MVRLVFSRLKDGKTYEIAADCGQTLMEAAVCNAVPGIIGECGGAGVCGTCHVYIDAAVRKILPAPAAAEEDMLAFVDKAKPVSRLACQITVSKAMDGMTFYLP